MGLAVDMGGLDLIVNDLKVGASTPGAAGTDIGVTDLTALAGVTAGTALASKVVILDSGSKVSGIKNITLAAGTATVAPEVLTAGTNLTSATAGATEFDGTCFYDTAVASSRQLRDTEQFIRQVGDSSAANNTGLDTAVAAAVFVSPASGQITLTAGTAYWIEAQYLLTNTGTTSHTWSTLFGGTATFTGVSYSVFGLSTTAANTPATGGLSGFANVATAVPVTAASTSATEQVAVTIVGVLNVNAGGTVIPQMKASARPGASGTPGVVVKDGSFFRCWALGPSATASVGNWS